MGKQKPTSGKTQTPAQKARAAKNKRLARQDSTMKARDKAFRKKDSTMFANAAAREVKRDSTVKARTEARKKIVKNRTVARRKTTQATPSRAALLTRKKKR